MKKIIYLILILSVSFYTSCSDDDKDPVEKNKFTVEAFYQLEGSTSNLPDENSKVYIFDGDYSDNSKFEYKGNGQFINLENSNWRNSQANYTISKYGSVDIECDFDCTIVVESNYYTDEYKIRTKKLNNSDKTISFVFSK